MDGPSQDTSVGDIVIINVPSDGPYGAMFEPDRDGCAAVVKAWERMPNGKFGIIQKHGGIHYGDVLFAVNDTALDVVPFLDAMNMIRDRNVLKKSLKFMNPAEHYRRKQLANSSAPVAMTDGKNNFVSIIRRARVSTDSNSSKFVEYEVACQYRVASMKVHREVVYKWSVWRRFSDFEKLNTAMKADLGWQMNNIEFPSSYTFTLNKLSPDFIEQRREELNRYYQASLKIDKVTDFMKHHCSRDLKVFLEVDQTMNSPKAVGFADGAENDRSASPEVSRGGVDSPSRKSMGARIPAGRRRSMKATSVKASMPSSSTSILGAAPTSASGSAPASASGPAPSNGAAPPPPPPPPASAPAVDPRFEQFAKMQKMGIPNSAIEGKMRMAGLSDSDIACFLNGSAADVSAPPAPGPPSGGAPPPPPPPPARPKSMPATTGARANLLGDIAKRRVE